MHVGDTDRSIDSIFSNFINISQSNISLMNKTSIWAQLYQNYVWRSSRYNVCVSSCGVVFVVSQIAQRRRSASGYKRQIATSGPPPVSRWLAGGTFPLLADIGHRWLATVDPPSAGHRWLDTIVPTMSAIVKNIRSENTCSSTITRGTYFLVYSITI